MDDPILQLSTDIPKCLNLYPDHSSRMARGSPIKGKYKYIESMKSPNLGIMEKIHTRGTKKRKLKSVAIHLTPTWRDQKLKVKRPCCSQQGKS